MREQRERAQEAAAADTTWTMPPASPNPPASSKPSPKLTTRAFLSYIWWAMFFVFLVASHNVFTAFIATQLIYWPLRGLVWIFQVYTNR
jgi:hypothetical protein